MDGLTGRLMLDDAERIEGRGSLPVSASGARGSVRALAFAQRFIREDDGQDIIEYGLLAGIIVVGAVALLPGIQTKMGNALSMWGQQSYDCWEYTPGTSCS
jgi:pilus assembly protein Flp/PilA